MLLCKRIVRIIHRFFVFPVLILSVLLLSVSCSDSPSPSVNLSWTVMFYGNGDNDLENHILTDLKEMELVRLPEQITVIALVDRPAVPSDKFGAWSDTKLFRVTYGDNADELSSVEIESAELSLTAEGEEELNMCDTPVLEKFIKFCRENYPSDRYALIIGSHGDGWKFPSTDIKKSIGYDGTPVNKSMSILNLASALKSAPPDVVVFDTCSMGNLETLYDLTGCAGYIVASPNKLPGSGFNYKDVFSKLHSGLTAENFALEFAASWKRVYDDTTMMVYSMEGFSDFMNYRNSGKKYFEKLSSAALLDKVLSLSMRNKSIKYSVNGIINHIDIADFAKNLIPKENIPFSSFILTAHKPMLSFYFPASMIDFEDAYNATSFSDDTGWGDSLKYILK